MIFTYVTASGSHHMVDRERLLYWRAPSLGEGYSFAMRKDFAKLSYLEANSPEPGEDLIVVLVGVAEGTVTVRRTSPVVTIEATNPKS